MVKVPNDKAPNSQGGAITFMALWTVKLTLQWP